MHPTVLIVAVLLLHGVSGHLLKQALPQQLKKHMHLPTAKAHTRQSDVDQCIENEVEDAFDNNATLKAICEAAVLKAENDIDNDDDDLSQSDVNAIFGALCLPDCGNLYIRAADDCGEFDGDDAPLKDFFIGMCGTNQDGDKCYRLYSDAINRLESEEECYEHYVDYKQCDCRSALTRGVSVQGCCLDVYYDLLESADVYDPSDLYDACNVDLPSGCNNSPISSGFMPQVALVTLISALIFSVLFS